MSWSDKPWPIIAVALSAILPILPPAIRRQGVPDDPPAIVRQAAEAVRGDSVPAVRARWQARFAHDSSDRAAILGLATLSRLTYDYPTAERLYRGLAASGSPDLYAVYARLGLGQGFDEYGRMQEVDGLFATALTDAHALRDRVAEGEALLWLGYVRSRSHGLKPAIALFDSALRVLPADAVPLRATTRCRRAQLLVIQGRGERAAGLESALELARRTGDPRVEAPCIRATAIALGHRGRPDSAAALYGTFANVLGRLHDRSGRALALVWQAVILREDLADYGDARETLYRAEAEARASHNLYATATTQLFLGQLFLALNDDAAAAAYLDQSVAAFAVVADSEALNVSRSWRALASLAAGDLARARRESLEPLGYFRRQGDLENQSEIVKTLANIAIRERDWAAAASELDSSEALLRRLGVVAWRAEQPFDRGRLALYRGDLPLAERGFTRYLGGLDSAAHLQRFEARAYLADSYARRGDLDRAERQLAAASDEVDAWRGTLSAQDLRITAFQANASAQNDRNASVARVLAALAHGGRVESAFSLAERRRARELIDRMQQNAALERARPGQPGVGLSQRVTQVTAAEVAAALPDDRTALLEYVTGTLGAPTTVFVLTRDRQDGHVAGARLLPPADSLTGPIGRFVALAARGADVSADARALGAALLQPAVGLLGSRVNRLVIVPDGTLHRLPWDALRLRDGRAAVEHYAIGIAPSAALVTALWRRAREESPSSAPTRLLAFGDPTFGPDPGAFAAAGGLPRLEGSGREAQAIARYAPIADVRLREAASESYLKRSRLSDYQILHFATHALVDDRVSVRTALALAPGGGEDGFVTPGELARLKLAARLVVLSACRTAGGVVIDGEGVQGLTAPLLEAGARSVVATSWRVGDKRTVWFVERFYAGLARGLPVVEALRDAKLEALHGGAGAGEWGAFTVVGDPFVTVRLRTGPS